jgi:hypothetical protein
MRRFPVAMDGTATVVRLSWFDARGFGDNGNAVIIKGINPVGGLVYKEIRIKSVSLF